MFPSFELFGRQISVYALFAIVGMLLAGYIFCRYIDKNGLDDNTGILFLLTSAIGVIVGGHTLYTITNLDKLYLFESCKSMEDFLRALGTVSGGTVFYGGLIGACIFGLAFIKLNKLPIDVYTDGCSVLAPLFHCVARIGCFFAGCCYGIESNIGFVAPDNAITDIGDVRRFPIQLLESLENLLIALLMMYLIKQKKHKGDLFCLYLMIYAICRFINEFFRGDEIRGFVLGMSTSQLISIIVYLIALLITVIKRMRSMPEKNGESYEKID